jgi:hypothetical protein
VSTASGRVKPAPEGKRRPCHSIATCAAVTTAYTVHAGERRRVSRTIFRDAAWQHRQKFEESTARPMRVGLREDARVRGHEGVLSAPHEINPQSRVAFP